MTNFLLFQYWHVIELKSVSIPWCQLTAVKVHHVKALRSQNHRPYCCIHAFTKPTSPVQGQGICWSPPQLTQLIKQGYITWPQGQTCNRAHLHTHVYNPDCMNQETFCCGATVLATKPPCCTLLIIFIDFIHRKFTENLFTRTKFELNNESQ